MHNQQNLPWVYKDQILRMLNGAFSGLYEPPTKRFTLLRHQTDQDPHEHDYTQESNQRLDVVIYDIGLPLTEFEIGCARNFRELTAMTPMQAFLHLCKVNDIDPRMALEKNLLSHHHHHDRRLKYRVSLYSTTCTDDPSPDLVFTCPGWPTVCVKLMALDDKLNNLEY